MNGYKKIIGEIKSKFFSDYEGELPQQVDLPNLVFDDQLLVNLFVERLKLEYEGADLTVSEEELEAGIVREKEILAQLAEMEETQPEKAADPKKGGKEKKGANKNADETLKEELDGIRKVQSRGWILVDFPRNLNQMKLLETSLSTYESKADLPKESKQLKFEAWSKVATPPCLVDEKYDGRQAAIQSGLDGVIILNTPNAECSRRAQSRKIDPQTQQVYDMDIEAPEDNKVLDRLQEYSDDAGKAERMQKISASFS